VQSPAATVRSNGEPANEQFDEPDEARIGFDPKLRVITLPTAREIERFVRARSPHLPQIARSRTHL
jgi:hypothetical protein